MRLPGTRYQEPGWEQVRKLLGTASLAVLQAANWQQLLQESTPDWYVEAMAVALQQLASGSRAQAPGNSYGEPALELAQTLVCEQRLLPSFWQAFRQVLPATPPGPGEGWASLRKKVNDLFASLRDRVDADYYQVATGRACSANKIYTWRMLDTAWHEIERLLLDWHNHLPQLSVILGREVLAQPIESRRVRSALDCDPAWIIRWSESCEQFGHGPGPLHTRSKRFSSLKNNPDTIARMLAEIAEYEALSANGVDQWQSTRAQLGDWQDDYARVMQQSMAAEAAGVSSPGQLMADDSAQNLFDEQYHEPGFGENPDIFYFEARTALEEAQFYADTGEVDGEEISILQALQAEGLLAPEQAGADLSPRQDGAHGWLASGTDAAGGTDAASSTDAAGGTDAADVRLAADGAAAQALGLPPGYRQMALAAEDRTSLMYRALQHESLAVRLALYSKQLGAWDDAYPDAWLDPASGELPTMKQLAALDGISLPTLRKRRDMALQRLQAASRQRDRR